MKITAESVRDFIHEWALNILILVFGITTLVQAFIVPTPSMDTTVMVGDHMLVDKLAYAPAGSFSKLFLPYSEPQRGDIIVFRYPMDINQNYVKRVMGVPGDRIKIVNKQLYVNGKALTEPTARATADACPNRRATSGVTSTRNSRSSSAIAFHGLHHDWNTDRSPVHATTVTARATTTHWNSATIQAILAAIDALPNHRTAAATTSSGRG